MKNDKTVHLVAAGKFKEVSFKTRVLIVALELSFILILLVLWLSSDSIQKSKNLWVLFFYSFPSQFLIGVVPHEPVFLYFSKFYSPVKVTAVAISGTLLTEFLNYSVFKFFTGLNSLRKLFTNKIIKKFVELFNKAPFVALLVAGFTPVPFYPLRFLVVLAHYPLIKYILALFLSRTPRFYCFAVLGNILKVPDYILLIIFISITILINIPMIKNLFKRRNQNQNET